MLFVIWDKTRTHEVSLGIMKARDWLMKGSGKEGFKIKRLTREIWWVFLKDSYCLYSSFWCNSHQIWFCMVEFQLACEHGTDRRQSKRIAGYGEWMVLPLLPENSSSPRRRNLSLKNPLATLPDALNEVFAWAAGKTMGFPSARVYAVSFRSQIF